jgi:O-antigen ligase/polysaccharide polymerase Wzy-like membrane protein
MRPMSTGPSERSWKLDSVSLLTLWMALLYLIPQKWVLPGGGSIARPAIGIGLVCAVLYVASRMVPSMVPPGRTPVALGLWAYGTLIVVSFALSFNRDLYRFELTAGIREVLLTASMVGVALLTAASIRDRERLEVLLKRSVAFAAVVASVAALQFYFDFDLVERVRFPGLRRNSEFLTSGVRSGFERAKGTTDHAIELGVVMAMAMPVAVHYALHEPDKRIARRFWLATFLIMSTIPMSVSRSGIVAVAVSMGFLVSVWGERQMLRAIGAGFVGVAIIYVSSPTLLGSIRSLFSALDSDPSVEGRTDDYETVFRFVAQRPWFGRGAGTWGADTNLLLDNQILLSLLEVGWIGVGILSFMYVSAVSTGRKIRRTAPDDATRHLGQALAGAIASGYLTLFFVDGLFFQIFVGTSFLYIGAVGAIYRMMHTQGVRPEVEALAQKRSLLSRRHAAEARPRWWTVALTDDLPALFEERSQTRAHRRATR